MKKISDDFTWAHRMPDNARILDNLGIRVNMTELPSWPKYRPWRDWYNDQSVVGRLRRFFMWIFRPEQFNMMRAQYEKWRFRYMQDLLNETLRQGQEIIDAN